jgi:hypothetical protein
MLSLKRRHRRLYGRSDQLMNRPSFRIFAAVLATVAVGGCGGAANTKSGTGATRPPTSPTTDPPNTGELPISGAVTTSPAPAGAEAEIQPMRSGVPTTPGTTYSLSTITGSTVDITITDPDGERFGYDIPGMAGIGNADDLSAQLVDIFELSTAEVFTDATVDFAELTGGHPPAGFFASAPDDFLSWMAGRPGVTAGPTTETTFAGHPAATMTYDVGSVDDSIPCYAGDDRGCLASITNSQVGYGYVDYEGTTMTLYQLDVAGIRLVVAVSELPGAADLAATITIDERAPPDVAPGAVPIERVRPLTSGAMYYWAGSSIGTYTLIGNAPAEVGPFSRPGFAWIDFTVEGYPPCMSITDGTQDVLVESNPDGSAQPAGPITADLIDVVIGNGLLEVIEPPTSITIGDVEATAIDVTTVKSDPVQVIGGGIPIWSDTTVRIVAIPRGQGAAPDVAMVVLGSPCEPMFDSLTVKVSE